MTILEFPAKAAAKMSAIDRAIAEMNARADAIVQRQIDEGVANYVRVRDCAGLIDHRVTYDQLKNAHPAEVLLPLHLKLHAERERIKTDRWTRGSYARLIRIRISIAAEEKALADMEAEVA